MTSLFLSLDVASSLVVQGSDPGGCREAFALRSGVSAAVRKMAEWEHVQKGHLPLAGRLPLYSTDSLRPPRPSKSLHLQQMLGISLIM